MIYGKKRNKAIIYNHLFLFLPLLPIQEDHEEEGKKIGGQRILWLKFLVLISFLSFAGFFDNPALDTKAHDHFRHETRDKYQSWKESKIGPTPTSENKMKNWGSIRPPSPNTRASIRWYLKVINLGRKPKTIPSSPSTNTPALSLTKLSTLWYKHLLIQLNKFTVQSFFSTNNLEYHILVITVL